MPGGGAPCRDELVDPKVFRVCADPDNMPFSNVAEEGSRSRSSQGFLPESSARASPTTYFPQVTGFVRHTLGG